MNLHIVVVSVSIPVVLLLSRIHAVESLLLNLPLPWWFYPLAVSYAALLTSTSRQILSLLTRARPGDSRLATLCYLAVGPLPGLTYMIGKIPLVGEPPLWVGSVLWLMLFSSAGAYLIASQNQS